MLNLILKDKRI